MTGWNGVRRMQQFCDAVDDHCILTLWRQGENTLDIARSMTVPEHVIANRLPHVLQRARQDDAWNVA